MNDTMAVVRCEQCNRYKNDREAQHHHWWVTERDVDPATMTYREFFIAMRTLRVSILKDEITWNEAEINLLWETPTTTPDMTVYEQVMALRPDHRPRIDELRDRFDWLAKFNGRFFTKEKL